MNGSAKEQEQAKYGQREERRKDERQGGRKREREVGGHGIDLRGEGVRKEAIGQDRLLHKGLFYSCYYYGVLLLLLLLLLLLSATA